MVINNVKISFTGRPSQVKVIGKDVPIKEIVLTDETSSRCKVTLWRELSSVDSRNSAWGLYPHH
jgi:hypothetical protein